MLHGAVALSIQSSHVWQNELLEMGFQNQLKTSCSTQYQLDEQKLGIPFYLSQLLEKCQQEYLVLVDRFQMK